MYWLIFQRSAHFSGSKQRIPVFPSVLRGGDVFSARGLWTLGNEPYGALIVVLPVPTNREVNIATPPSAFIHGPSVFAGKFLSCNITFRSRFARSAHLLYKRRSYRFELNFLKECVSKMQSIS